MLGPYMYTAGTFIAYIIIGSDFMLGGFVYSLMLSVLVHIDRVMDEGQP